MGNNLEIYKWFCYTVLVYLDVKSNVGVFMIKKIDILGMQLDNYTVREAIMQVETYLSNNVLNTIESVSMKMLMEAETNSVVREVLSSMDLTVIGEAEIMQAAGTATMQRMQETKSNDFAAEFFKRVERNKKTIFVVGQTEKQIDDTKKKLHNRFPNLMFVGEYAVENCVGDLEGVINDMNALAPDIILSVLPTPLQEQFLMDHKDKMNANIWYGAGELEWRKDRRSLSAFLWRKVHMERLRNNINKYNKDSEIEPNDDKENEA